MTTSSTALEVFPDCVREAHFISDDNLSTDFIRNPETSPCPPDFQSNRIPDVKAIDLTPTVVVPEHPKNSTILATQPSIDTVYLTEHPVAEKEPGPCTCCFFFCPFPAVCVGWYLKYVWCQDSN